MTLTEQEMIVVNARNLYWGYVKETRGTPGKWSDLNEERRKLWLAMARRAVRKVDELRPQPTEGMT